jgi:hypothetical protein
VAALSRPASIPAKGPGSRVSNLAKPVRAHTLIDEMLRLALSATCSTFGASRRSAFLSQRHSHVRPKTLVRAAHAAARAASQDQACDVSCINAHRVSVSSAVFPALQFRQTSNDPVRLCFVHPRLLAAQTLVASHKNILLSDSKVKMLGPGVLVEMVSQVLAEFVALGDSVSGSRRFEPTGYQVQLHERSGYFGLVMVIHRDGVPRVEACGYTAP